MSTNKNNKNGLTFDLNIHNYTIKDLKGFFKLSDNYDLIELTNAQESLIKSVSQSDQPLNQQNEIILFINKTNKILQYELEDDNSIEHPSTTTKEKVTKTNMLQSKNDNPLGKILLPFSSRQPLQIESIQPNNISGYGINTNVVSYVFNTQLRDQYFYTTPSNCTFTLPTKIENIISVQLSALQIPNVMLAFSKLRGTNQLYIKEDVTENNALVIIPDGNYQANEFATVLTNAINQQVTNGVPRFNVVINPYTNQTTITNSTYSFAMNIIKKEQYYDCSEKEHYRLGIPDKSSADPKHPDIPPSALFNSMGYNIGYRKIEYMNKRSYTAEGNYNTTFTSYIYFVFDDYNNCYIKNTVGVLPNYQIKSNILGVIPITAESFAVEFNNTADLVNRTRTYNSPISISKFSIQILNQYGEILDLNLNDYAFCIQFTCIYNISTPYNV